MKKKLMISVALLAVLGAAVVGYGFSPGDGGWPDGRYPQYARVP